MKRVELRRIASVPLILLISSISIADPASAGEPPRLTAGAAILMDYATGEILYGKNPSTVRPPASLTKMMTALVAFDRGQTDKRVTVSSTAVSAPGAAFGMNRGDKPPMWKLIYGMLLRSGNDAAVSVAEGVAGGESAFVSLMNGKAKALGMMGTHFENPHGMNAKGHVSTARDLGILARTALQNPDFARVVNTRKLATTWNGRPRDIWNINKFLSRFPGAEGIKTGYTDPAGYCLAAVASKSNAVGRGTKTSLYRKGDRLICIILGSTSSNNRYSDAESLLKWGLAGGYAKADPSDANRDKGQGTRIISSSSGPVYEVSKGDNLSTIAAENRVSLRALQEANGIKDADSIHAGVRLVIPKKK